MDRLRASTMLAPDLAEHAAYARVFQPGRLTLGFIAPLEAYPNAPWPTLAAAAGSAPAVTRSSISGSASATRASPMSRSIPSRRSARSQT